MAKTTMNKGVSSVQEISREFLENLSDEFIKRY